MWLKQKYILCVFGVEICTGTSAFTFRGFEALDRHTFDKAESGRKFGFETSGISISLANLTDKEMEFKNGGIDEQAKALETGEVLCKSQDK